MTPILMIHYQLTLEHKVLIVLYVLSYLGAMFIQIKDPEQRVTFADWVLAFITSVVGAVITYFGVMSWANIGLRMAATIVASLVSYRTFVLIVSEKSQNSFASGFWNGIMGLLKALFSGFSEGIKKRDENNRDENNNDGNE